MLPRACPVSLKRESFLSIFTWSHKVTIVSYLLFFFFFNLAIFFRQYVFSRLSGKLRTKEEGADTIIWLALQPKEKLVSGAFYFDRAEAPKHLMFAATSGSHAYIDSIIGNSGLCLALPHESSEFIVISCPNEAIEDELNHRRWILSFYPFQACKLGSIGTHPDCEDISMLFQ